MSKNRLIIITSWDDVTEFDLKLCGLLDKYKLKGTFYVIGKFIGKKISKDQLLRMSKNHELGAHTMSHLTLTSITREKSKKEIIESKKTLEECINEEVTSFAYPKGIYNDEHVKIVKEAGFTNARNIEPFYFDITGNAYEIPITLWSYPHKLRDLNSIYRLYNSFPLLSINPLMLKNWNRLGKKILDRLLERGGVFHLFGHAWQVDQIRGWEKLEDLFAYMAFRKEATYCTLSNYTSNILVKGREVG